MAPIVTFPHMPQSLQNAICLLTSSMFLMPRFKPQTIEALSRSLCISLLPMTETTTGQFRITFHMNSTISPPTPLLVACMMAGISWSDWCISLMGGPGGIGKDSVLEVWESGVKWTGEGLCPVLLRSPPSRRLHSSTNAKPELDLNMLVGDYVFAVVPPTPSPVAKLADATATTSKLDVPPTSSSFSTLSSENISASLEDVEMDAPSRYHSRSSSLSSLTSITSLPSSKSCYPRPSTPEPTVRVDTSIPSVTAYKYQGGETSVLGGGVMLSGAGDSSSVPPSSGPVRRVTRSATRLASSKENTADSIGGNIGQNKAKGARGRGRACSRVENWRTKI